MSEAGCKRCYSTNIETVYPSNVVCINCGNVIEESIIIEEVQSIPHSRVVYRTIGEFFSIQNSFLAAKERALKKAIDDITKVKVCLAILQNRLAELVDSGEVSMKELMTVSSDELNLHIPKNDCRKLRELEYKEKLTELENQAAELIGEITRIIKTRMFQPKAIYAEFVEQKKQGEFEEKENAKKSPKKEKTVDEEDPIKAALKVFQQKRKLNYNILETLPSDNCLDDPVELDSVDSFKSENYIHLRKKVKPAPLSTFPWNIQKWMSNIINKNRQKTKSTCLESRRKSEGPSIKKSKVSGNVVYGENTKMDEIDINITNKK